MANQARRAHRRRSGEPSVDGALARTRRNTTETDETDRLLDEIDAVLDSVPDDGHVLEGADEPDYPVLHRWLGYLCVTLFIWILIVSALGAPVLWIRYGFN